MQWKQEKAQMLSISDIFNNSNTTDSLLKYATELALLRSVSKTWFNHRRERVWETCMYMQSHNMHNNHQNKKLSKVKIGGEGEEGNIFHIMKQCTCTTCTVENGW